LFWIYVCLNSLNNSAPWFSSETLALCKSLTYLLLWFVHWWNAGAYICCAQSEAATLPWLVGGLWRPGQSGVVSQTEVLANTFIL